MASDQEVAKAVEILLREAEPKAITSLNDVVQQLEAKLGLDLSHKAYFISNQINLFLRSHAQFILPPKDNFALQTHHQFPYGQHQLHHPHFALQHQHQLPHSTELNSRNPTPPPQPPPALVKAEGNVQNAAANSSKLPKKSVPAGTKRKGGPGGLNKLCGVSPELQAVVGEPALSRTEIVKQLWAYIKKNNLQDPSNKRKIICDDALRLVFETDCTDMFKMNKLLAKHIIRLEPIKESTQAKRVKVHVEFATESAESNPPPVLISEALSKFLGNGEREMLQSEALRCMWEYIKVNNLEDPLRSMVIICDAKLRELFGCESISTLGISEMLARHHLFKH